MLRIWKSRDTWEDSFGRLKGKSKGEKVEEERGMSIWGENECRRRNKQKDEINVMEGR